MAITRADYEIFARLRIYDQVPDRPRLLEIGEAEYYGDVPFDDFQFDIKRWGRPEQRQEIFTAATRLINRAKAGDLAGVAHDLAKLVYAAFLNVASVSSIDLHGTERARKLDLNLAHAESGRFDIVYNTGTAEHIFRIGQVLESIHEWTAPDGLMIHCFPFTGLLDHGFYNVNPTLIFDLARANDYETLYLAISRLYHEVEWLDPQEGLATFHDMARQGTLPQDAWLHVVYRKTSDAVFKIPIQAFYDDALSDPELNADWKTLR